jgi:dienelactone hydrolase
MKPISSRVHVSAERACRDADGFTEFTFSTYVRGKRVLKIGTGPPVLVMHELPGLTPQCLRLARLIAQEGFTVYLPLLFGQPNQHQMGLNLVRICMSREFHLFSSSGRSPVVDWLRALGLHMHEKHQVPGIGVIGMCLTGGFALAMVADAHVLAGVSSQPSLPAAWPWAKKCSLGLGSAQVEGIRNNGEADILVLRFEHDWISPPGRMSAVDDLGEKGPNGSVGPKLRKITLRSDLPGLSAAPHAVLTEELQAHDPSHPTMEALTQVISLLKSKL